MSFASVTKLGGLASNDQRDQCATL